MSKFLPPTAVLNENNQHMKRLRHGLKVGTHVKYPDPEKGPYVLTKKLVERMKANGAKESGNGNK